MSVCVHINMHTQLNGCCPLLFGDVESETCCFASRSASLVRRASSDLPLRQWENVFDSFWCKLLELLISDVY